LLSVNQSLRKREKVFAAKRPQASEKGFPNYPAGNLRSAKNTYLKWKINSKRWKKFVTSDKPFSRNKVFKTLFLTS
tara:strand:+ start:996 stop:1223 length:228 start_codon:yes stop_codon:yes gene_type:complete